VPGVSAQVSRLERELGAPLIDRSGGTATLTAAGAAVLELARQTLASADAVRRTVQGDQRSPARAAPPGHGDRLHDQPPEATAPTAVLDLAGRRLGVAVLSASMLTGRDDLTTIQIRDVKRTANLALVWRPGPGPAARELLDYLHTAFGLAPAGP
jgi:DNA-binding transcriptional LysR family regulator